MEAQTEKQQRTEEEGLRLPRKELRSQPPFEGSRRPHRHKEALLQEARREEVEVREVLKALRRSIRLEGSL